MSVENLSLDESESKVNLNIDRDETLRKIREELAKSISSYRNILSCMTADAPMAVLGIHKNTEKELLNAGCLRVYDLLNRDFTKIEGLSAPCVRDLTARFNEFIAML